MQRLPLNTSLQLLLEAGTTTSSSSSTIAAGVSNSSSSAASVANSNSSAGISSEARVQDVYDADRLLVRKLSGLVSDVPAAPPQGSWPMDAMHVSRERN